MVPMTTAAGRSLTDALKQLFVHLEDLLKRIADTDDIHIRRLRASVRAQMIAVQRDIPTLQSPGDALLSPALTAPRKAAQDSHPA